jgi:hypothetical protein
MAQRLSAAGPKAPLLARWTRASTPRADARASRRCNAPGLPQVDWLIKWNPRSTDVAALAAALDAEPAHALGAPRERASAWRCGSSRCRCGASSARAPRAAAGRAHHRQARPAPDRARVRTRGLDDEPAGAIDAQEIIALYADHGTHEQFHSEFKTDLDLSGCPRASSTPTPRVPAAALAMNILRLMGQRGLLGPDAPVRHSAKRRRIKTVMQELIYRAGRDPSGWA